MKCIICNAYIGEQASSGRKRKYCEAHAKAKKQKYITAYKKRVKAQGKPEARPDKTDAELEAIKAKYSNPEAMDYAIAKIAGKLTEVLVTNDIR